MCRSCSAGYYSEGFCCDTGKYHKLGQGCINIPITDCEKFDGVECQQCSSTLNSFNRCCDGQVYREKQKGCVNTNADWGILDIFNDVLVTCAAGKYPISNDVCCSDDEYWKVDAVNGDGCVAFATATDCKRTYKTIDTDTYANCRECSTADHVNYFDEGCEDLSGTDVYVKIGGNITAVNNDALYTNCSSLDADGLCDKCKADFNLGSGLCCADGSVAGDDLSCKGYDDATANGVPQMTNCKNGLKATCSACDDGFFLRANDTATEPCCDIGRVPLANGCGDGSNTGVANCISYPDINVATKC
ncbi:MAG: hypothetical protein DHS20C13_26100 [Thermodesulfobacteriota bacterium]|nr:MAG: hypothetical protein DHS20C13_26100 [Thermodesulfobacteriota bacterium]